MKAVLSTILATGVLAQHSINIAVEDAGKGSRAALEASRSASRSFLKSKSVVNLGVADDGDYGSFNRAAAGAEARRRGAESAGLSKLVAAYNNALTSAQASILGSFAKVNKSFLADASLFRARVLGGNHDESAAIDVLNNIEGKRQAEENALIDQAAAEMHELGKVVSGHVRSFLQGGMNVRVSPVDSPTLTKLIQDVESRRDNAENRLRAEILNMELNLVKSLRGFTGNAFLACKASKPMLSVGLTSSFLKGDDSVLIRVHDSSSFVQDKMDVQIRSGKSFLKRQPTLDDLKVVAAADEEAAAESLAAAKQQASSFVKNEYNRKTQAPMIWFHYNN